MANKYLTDKEGRAWDFARESHLGQKRAFSGLSYFDAHVVKVNGILKQFTTDEDMLCAAILHDVLEDCFDNKEEGYNVILENFGKRVADLVLELTSDGKQIRRLGKTKYLSMKMIGMSSDALTIKLCDRFQNIEDSFSATESFRNRYTKETFKIIKALEEYKILNRTHRRIINNIRGKLRNVRKFFKKESLSHLKTFEKFVNK